MHFLAVTSILVAAVGLCHAQADDSTNTTTTTTTTTPTNENDHWCGEWAGVPKPEDVPSGEQLPRPDFTKKLFIEPQLQRTPFAPVMGKEDRVQIPKIWGNNEFRLALLSYTDYHKRVYASSKSTWGDIDKALGLLMTNCVNKGTGGAYLVPPTPTLTQSTLVIYAYAVGSYFDFQMNYYMSQPYGINPANIQQDFKDVQLNASANVAAAIL